MTPQQFSQMIRSKYPNGVTADGIKYSDLSDEDLTQRVLNKYPSYKSQVKFEPTNNDVSTSGSSNPISDFSAGFEEAVSERAGSISEEIGRAKDGEISGARAGLRAAGHAAGFVGDVGFEAIKLITPKFIEDFTAGAMGKVAETEIAQAAFDKYEELKQKHPEAIKDIEAVFNIASLVPAGKVAQVGLKASSRAGSKVVEKTSKITGEILESRRARSIEEARQEIDSVVGRIVQGDKADVSRAKNALSTINTTGVKTYTDLKERINDGIEALVTKVDEQLESVGETMGVLRSKDLTTVTKVGKTTVRQNFVEDAITQLDELYVKIKDTPGSARIKELQTKLSKEGLTLRELNDLAREYSREFGTKAFSKVTGDPLTSINAQAFENTRKGIKNLVRSKMPDDVTKMLDQRMSEMINTNRLVTKMEERVNKLYQRAKQRGVIERVARRSADLINLATFNTLPGFLSRMLPSNVGLKVMNSIDLEEALNKNLNKLDKLLKKTDDDSLTDGIIELLKDNPR